MKIKKFPQSCVLIEINGFKMLLDPSTVDYDEKFLKDWKTADIILVTHRHSDHINPEALKILNKPIYSTSEVAKFFPDLKINLVKDKDVLNFKNIKIEIVKAIHGYMVKAGKVEENIGFIIDDNKTRIYYTSDTIRFENDYKADILLANITAFDASMNLWGAVQTMKDVGARLLVVLHQDLGKVIYPSEYLKDYLNNEKVNYIIPKINEEFEV